MVKTDQALVMFTALVAVLASAHGSGAEQEENDAVVDVAPIVSAQVSSVKSEGRGQKVILAVTHVYCGSERLVGREFTVETMRVGSVGVLVLPRLKVGEVGIWQVRDDNGSVIAAAYEMQSSEIVQLPAFKSNQVEYREAIAWAKVVRQISIAEPKKQIGLLKQAMTNPEPAVSAWAVETIGRMQPKSQLAFLERLVDNKKLSIRGQVMLDTVLTKLKDKKWYLSEARAALLRKWVRSKMGLRDVGKVLRRIDMSWQRRETDTQMALELIKTAALNEGIPPAIREQCCLVVARGAMREKDDDKAFKLLIEFIHMRKKPRLRTAAAYAIGHAVGTDKARLAAIRTARMAVKDGKVRKILGEAIEKVEKALRSKTEGTRQPKP